MLSSPDARRQSEHEADDVRHLDKVLHSKCFERAPRLRSLLLYLWANRDSDISEYAIAVDALERSSDFDPKIDAIVRVQIARLRAFLTKYYAAEGHDSTTWLTIPLGTHKVQLMAAAQEQTQSETLIVDADQGLLHNVDVQDARPQELVALKTLDDKSLGRMTTYILISSVVLLSLGVAVLLGQLANRGDGNSKPMQKPEVPIFWKAFTDNGNATRIVLPTPVFFSWKYGNGANTIVARDLSVNGGDKLDSSDALGTMEKRYGKPDVWQNYTFASDTFAALRLVHFLDSFGIQTSISSSAESPNAITDYENIVAFGTTSSLTAYQSDLDRLSYKLGSYERFVIDKRLPPGSPVQFPFIQESASRLVAPGLIALLPRGKSGGRILLLQGAQTTALVSYLTSESGFAELAKAKAQHGHNLFFEAIILSEVNGENPIQSRLVAFRTFAP